MHQALEGDDGSEELSSRLQTLRLASNDGGPVDDVVFGHLSVAVKDCKAWKMAGLSCVMRVVYPNKYQTAIPDQQTREVLGHVFSLHNITTEGTVVLELFKGVPLAVKALRKALSKRVGSVQLPVSRMAEGEHTMWLPIKAEKEVTDFGVPQLQVTVRFEKKTSVTIDDFELLKLLGRGKFGKVFLCKQKATGKVYAIKMIRKQDLNSNAVDIHHTLVERLILSSVEHPFICNLKFAFQDSDKVYFVLQYIEGGELMYHVHSQGRPLEMARVVFYAAELVLALEYLHSRNVIYRDLKPENVLIDKDGHVRLTDFGLSKIAKNKTHSICVPDHHQVLTSRGFLHLDGYLDAIASDPGLLVASYDPDTKHMCWDRPLGHVVLPAERRTLVDFDDGNGVRYQCTEEHRVFATPGSLDSRGIFCPSHASPLLVSAGDYLSTTATHAVHVTRANALRGCSRSPAASQVLLAWGEIFGAALRGSVALVVGDVLVLRGAEAAWLAPRLAGTCSSSRLLRVSVPWARSWPPTRLPQWALDSGDVALAISRGLGCGTQSFHSLDPLARDMAVTLLLAAGFAPVCCGQWVHWGEDGRTGVVAAARAASVESSGRVWCLRMPRSLFWVRSAGPNGPSRPVVTGNCGTPQFLAPEMILYAKTTGYDRMVDWWALGIVIHEMASCALPFDDENHQQLYRKIVYEQPVYPLYFTPEISDLLDGLLTKDPAQRLGQQSDEIKTHPFFQSINWEKLEAKELEPPFVPKLKKATDTAYFYKSFTTAEKKDSVALISIADETQERFRHFSFTNLTELTGDAGADGSLPAGTANGSSGVANGGSGGTVPPVVPGLVLDDKRAPTKQPEYVITHRNPLQALASSNETLTLRAKQLLARDQSPECPTPPAQLSVHPWPTLMTEAPEHSAWPTLSSSEDENTWWGAPTEPGRVLCCGRSLTCWIEDGGLRAADEALCYVLCDASRRRVSVWHGAQSTPAMRGRATRVCLMWAAELGYSRAVCPIGALRSQVDLHNPPPISFPRSLDEARVAAPQPDLLTLTDGRRAAWLWTTPATSALQRAQALEAVGAPAALEVAGAESAVFRAHFRVLWGDLGDAALRKVRARRRYAARRPFEASCVVDDMLWVLGEGEVPHWCYVLNTTSHARGVLPLAVWSDDEYAALTRMGGDQDNPPPIPEPSESVSSSAEERRMSRSARSRSTGGLTSRGSVISSGESAGGEEQPTSPREKEKTPLLQKLSTMRQSRKERRKGGSVTHTPEEAASFPGIRLRVVPPSEPSQPTASGQQSPKAALLEQNVVAFLAPSQAVATQFACPQCERVFGVRGHLLEHMHSGQCSNDSAAVVATGASSSSPSPSPPPPNSSGEAVHMKRQEPAKQAPSDDEEEEDDSN